VRGLPNGLKFETLNKLCLDQFGESLKDIRYVHISGWKTLGAFRLLLRCKGRLWTLIYKNALYSTEQIPALVGLSIRPGFPEYLIYNYAQGALVKYLPIVHLCSEIVPGEQYQYLFEDLRPKYRSVQYTSTDMINLAAEIPTVHQAMRDWLPNIDQDGLLKFGREYSEALLRYAKETLERYEKETEDKAVSEVCKHWSQISKLYQSEEFYKAQTYSPIHGDFNPSNVHLHNKSANCIKIVDWEWTGLGLVQADLVSLLKGVDPEIEKQALRRFCQQNNDLSFEEHKLLYQRCQLERNLLDGAFLAKQLMQASDKIDWGPGFVRASMQQVLNTYNELTQ
jgi:hypothetical protein